MKTKIYSSLTTFFIALLLVAFSPNLTLAAGETSNNNTDAKAKNYATSPAKCGSIKGDKDGNTPWNCLFLEEPIGGKVGFDLYIQKCEPSKTNKNQTTCTTTLWSGGVVPLGVRGPIQAILTEEKDKPYQGPFGLLYGYVNLVYDYMSGLIIGVVVFFIVLGGVQMTTSAGDTAAFDAGKNRIIKALVGMVLWFLASLILYTINPTFFTF